MVIETTWLSDALVRAGALVEGGIRSFKVEPFESNHGTNSRIALEYEPGSTGELPDSLFLKVCTRSYFGRSEVDFYLQDYAALDGAPVVRCYAAAFQETPRSYHILLEDLSATHLDQRDQQPSRAYAVSLADALARLHGHRWGIERLGAAGYAVPTQDALERFVSVCSRGLPRLLQEVGGNDARILAHEWSELPAGLSARSHHPDHLTLVHADVNPTNVLAARDPASGLPLYVVDRQPFDWSLTVWTGASDLAYAMGLYWDPEPRARLEHLALGAYYETLLSDVSGYEWSDLLADYRLGLAQAIAIPANWCADEPARERMRWLWTRQASRLAAALRDAREPPPTRGPGRS